MTFEHFDSESPNLKAREELGDDPAVNHISDLFDTKEDVFGEKTDLATGKPIDNTRATVVGISHIDPDGSDDVLGTIPEEDDDAEKWLRTNDPSRRPPDEFREAA